MAKKKALTDQELAKLCNEEFDNSQSITTEIQAEREKSLKAYDQEKYGNEQPGLSGFVTSDVRDAIEWTLPQLVDIFVGGDTPVTFEAENAEDAAQADQESRYCQYVFERQNKGVIVVYSWLKDALIQKNGIVKATWDERVEKEREEYKNKTGQEFMMLANDPEFEIKEVSIYVNEVEYDEEEYAEIMAGLAADPEAQYNVEMEAEYHIVGYRKKNIGQTYIANVAPENFVVKRDHNSIFLKDASYCCEIIPKTRSELVEEGYDYDMVMALPAGQDIQLNDEKNERMKKEGGSIALDQNSIDPSRQIVQIYDHYIRADKDGDGYSELYFVRTAGKSCDHVLECEEVDRNPYHAITPYLNTHKFFGRSMADNLMDLQRAKSQLWRNGFDNIMYSAIPRKIISGNVNVGDLLSFVPGGVIRKDAQATVDNDTTPFVAGEIFPLMDRLDNTRAERSGFSKDSMGLNPEALANSTNLVGMSIMAQSQLLVKMIATIVANSGYSELMLHIRELLLKYEKQRNIIDLTGAPLQVDPRSWRKQRSTIVKVGIGFAGKQEELALLDRMALMQEKAVQGQGGISGPLVSPTHIFNLFRRQSQRMGVKDVQNYFQDPATYQAPPPSPSIAEVSLKAQIEKLNNDQTQNEAKLSLDRHQMDLDQEFKLAELTQSERIAAADREENARQFDLEMLYKYGKDAHDRVTNDLQNLSNLKGSQDAPRPDPESAVRSKSAE